MEFKINSKELSKRLEQLAKVVLQKNVMPILADVMMDIRGDVVVLTTSDGELWLSLKCPLVSSDGDIKLCVNIKDLLSLMSNIDNDVTITVDDGESQITCNYGNGEFNMPYDKADEYPTGDNLQGEAKSVIVEGRKIYNAIRMTEFAIATNTATVTVSPVLGGMNFDFNANGMSVSATNRFKIAIYNDDTVRDGEGSVNVPKKTISIMSSLLGGIDGEVKISFNNSYISVSNTDLKLSSRLVDGRFPDCKKIIPESPSLTVSVKKNDLLLALKRVMPMSNDVSELVKMEFGEGHVTLTTENAIFGKRASETVECDCNQSFVIGFKGSDLTEIIRNIDDEDVTMELTDATRAGVFYASSAYTKDEYVSLLSPSNIQ